MVYNVDLQRSRLYSKDRYFKRFVDLTEEDEKRIEAEVKRTQLRFEDLKHSKVDICARTITFLNTVTANRIFKTYDEKVYFLITCLDPNLEFYKLYLSHDITTSRQIENAKDKEEKERLKELRSTQLSKFRTAARVNIGYYDPVMLRYEMAFFEKYLSNKTLWRDIQADYSKNFLDNSSYIRTFDIVRDERYQEINQKVMEYLSVMGEDLTYKNLSFHLIAQNELLGVKTNREKAIFFILTLDPELDILSIFDEESKWENIIRRVKEKFGFYDERLIRLERLFASKFMQEKFNDPWTLQKKTDN